MFKNEDIKFGLILIGFMLGMIGLVFLLLGIIPLLLIGLLYLMGDIFNFDVEFIYIYILLMLYGLSLLLVKEELVKNKHN